MQGNPASIESPSAVDETQVSPEVRETAVRLGALMRHLFAFDNGRQLRAMEESGLNFTQIKMMMMLGSSDLNRSCAGGELAEAIGLSITTVSRTVDSLVEMGLVTRAEDPDDRRVRQIGITEKGRDVINRVMAARLTGLIAFAECLGGEERRKLDAALEILMQREELADGYRLIDGLGTR